MDKNANDAPKIDVAGGAAAARADARFHRERAVIREGDRVDALADFSTQLRLEFAQSPVTSLDKCETQ